MFTFKLWRNGRTISLHFLDGPEWAHEKAIAYMRRWTAEVNLRFVVTQDRLGRSRHARAGRLVELPRHRQLRDARGRADHATQMATRLPGRGGRVAASLHPRGRSYTRLRPRAGPTERRDRLEQAGGVRVVRRPPQLLVGGGGGRPGIQEVLGIPITNFSAYDRLSIMHYAIPAQFVLDPSDAVGWNTSRSPADRRYAALWYPKAKTRQVITQLLDDLVHAAETQLAGEHQARTSK
jgi:hypothetical protein